MGTQFANAELDPARIRARPSPAAIAGLGFASWPPGRESVVLSLLSRLGITPEPQAGICEIIEYDDFADALPERFDQALATGQAEDSSMGFIAFASSDFTAWQEFSRQYLGPKSDRLVLPMAMLRSPVEAWLPGLLRQLAPGSTVDLPPAASLAAFTLPPRRLPRHGDAALHHQLSQLRLCAEEVVAVFTEMMGRAPGLPGLLALQCLPSLDLLREKLKLSPEYLQLMGAQVLQPLDQPTQFVSFAAHFDRPLGPETKCPPSAAAQPDLLAAARKAADRVKQVQEAYQPFYGLEDPGQSQRSTLLRARCQLVTSDFAKVLRKGQVRILDVGCNAGFVSFTLAETFPNVIGIDVNDDNIALCRALKALSGSPALFFNVDILDLIETDPAAFEALDAVLFLNVIHQLIFARGLAYVQEMLGRLSRQVDLIVVELARAEDYIPFGKDHLLPLDPAEVLAGCDGATIKLAHDGARPVYTIRRRSLTVAKRPAPYSRVGFTDHASPLISRKYYYGSNSFTKMIRFNSRQGKDKFRAELSGLQALQGTGAAPEVLAAEQTEICGKITMTRLFGPSLVSQLPKLSGAEKAQMLREVIRLAAILAKRGVCQNDFSGHNFIRLRKDRVAMVDFELSGPIFLRDPYASLLWIAHDLIEGRASSYQKIRADQLVLSTTPLGTREPRVGQEAYPQLDPRLSEAHFGKELAQMLEELRKTEQDWSSFIQSAWQGLV